MDNDPQRSLSRCILIPSEPDLAAQKRVRVSTGNSALKVTCQVRLDLPAPPPSCRDNTIDDRSDVDKIFGGWRLTCLDDEGAPKQNGGDEFYVEYKEELVGNLNVQEEETESTSPVPPAPHLFAVAFVTDLNNGPYDLRFSTTPTYPSLPETDESDDGYPSQTIRRTLTVYLDYSNRIGSMAPPSKAEWQDGGYTHTQYSIQVNERPPNIQKFQFQPSQSTPNLRNFDKVICFGDSTMDQFVRQRPNTKGKYYFQPNLIVGEKVTMGLNSETVEDMLQELERQHGALLNETCKMESSCPVALLLCSALWDILDSQDTMQGESYDNHRQALQEYIERIRQSYPHVTIVWKLPMAVHPHVVQLERLVDAETGKPVLFGIDRLRYMSKYRSRYIYELQKELMQELDVKVLDIYDATHLSAHRLYPSDGRHYRADLNRLMLNWFFYDEDSTY